MAHTVFGTFYHIKILFTVYLRFRFNDVSFILPGSRAPYEPEMWGFVIKNQCYPKKYLTFGLVTAYVGALSCTGQSNIVILPRTVGHRVSASPPEEWTLKGLAWPLET